MWNLKCLVYFFILILYKKKTQIIYKMNIHQLTDNFKIIIISTNYQYNIPGCYSVTL